MNWTEIQLQRFSWQLEKEKNRNVNRELEFYNLDAIIGVGYRLNYKKSN